MKVNDSKFIQNLKLFFLFSLLGVQMFGNVSAVLPILQKELIDKRNLITKEDLLDSVAIGRCGPGAAIINTVAFIGNKINGISGGICTSIGFIFMPFIIIICIASFIDKIIESVIIKNIFAGLLVCISVLIINTLIDLWKNTIVNKTSLLIFCVILFLELFFNIPIFMLILLSGILGFVLTKIDQKNNN